MKTVDTSLFSNDECWGIQINGLSHCNTISCCWQGLSACEGKTLLKLVLTPRVIKLACMGLL